MKYISKILRSTNMILILLLGIILLGVYTNSHSQVIVSVTTNKKVYNYGEPVEISVIAKNPSPRAINLWFGSDYQADYIIDNNYQWSKDRNFLPVLTFVVIAGNDSAVWSFTHTKDEYNLTVGFHKIEGLVVDYGRSISPTTIQIIPTKAKISLPDTIGKVNTTMGFPISVSTDSMIGLAQFIVEYNSYVVNFLDAQVAPDATGFIITKTNTNLPFKPTTPGTNENVLVQISGGGSHYFTGPNRKPVVLNFNLVGAVVNGTTPLAFDQGVNRTFLTTKELVDLTNGDIFFNNGALTIIGDVLSVISGTVTYYDGLRPVYNTKLTLELVNEDTTSANPIKVAKTDPLGFYAFTEITVGSHIILTPFKKYDTRNAITGADALLILRYLAFLEDLTPDQKISADVTRDGKISGADAFSILIFLAFGPGELPVSINHIGEWIFKPDSINTIFKEYTGEQDFDFTAYLLGDATGNWGKASNSSVLYKDVPVGDNQEKILKSNVSLQIGKVTGIQNEKIVVPIFIDSKDELVNTIVLTLDYDPSIFEYELTSLTNFTKEFMMAAHNNATARKIHIATVGVEGIEGKDKILEVIFRVKDLIKKEAISDFVLSRVVINDIEIKDKVKGEIRFSKEPLTLLPDVFKLSQNYPNPFNMETIISFTIPENYNEGVTVTLKVYNTNGQVVMTLVNERITPGIYTTYWDGRDELGQYVSSGLYFYTMTAGEFRETQKMILMK